MNKFNSMLVGLVGLTASGAAFAAYPDITGSTNVTMVDCDLLANDIVVMASGGVVGAMECDTTNNVIAVSMCHTSGLTTERTVKGENPTDGNCDDGFDLSSDGTSCTKTTTGAGFPTATSAKGTVSSRYPQGACTSAAALTEAKAQITKDLQ